MKIKVVLLVCLMVAVCLLGSSSAQVITTKRQFPGQRRLGQTNYGTHSFGSRGYNSNPVSRSSGPGLNARRRTG